MRMYTLLLQAILSFAVFKDISTKAVVPGPVDPSTELAEFLENPEAQNVTTEITELLEMPDQQNFTIETTVSEIQDIFNQQDFDQSGKLSLLELAEFLAHPSLADLSPAEAPSLIARYDVIKDKEMDQSEFASFFNNRVASLEHQGILKLFDANRDGFVDREEIRGLLDAQSDVPLTEQELTLILAPADLNKDGKLDILEIKRIFL